MAEATIPKAVAPRNRLCRAASAAPLRGARAARQGWAVCCGAGVFRYPGRFIWQLVGVLDT